MTSEAEKYWICLAEASDREHLLGLGLGLLGLGLGIIFGPEVAIEDRIGSGTEYRDCTIPDDAFEKLDEHFGRYIWGPEKSAESAPQKFGRYVPGCEDASEAKVIATVAEGHTPHCAARIVWGDGLCECEPDQEGVH